MTKPITHRALLTAGRPKKQAPSDIARQIEALAADGWSMLGISKKLGVNPRTFRGWLDDDISLKEAFDFGREQERWQLHNMLFKQAMEAGNSSAAMFLLKSRHGYREGAEVGESNRVAITFNLPGALQPDQFLTVEKSHERVTDDQSVSGKGFIRS